MSLQTAQNGFQIRTDLDLTDVYGRLRSEFGSDIQTKDSLSREMGNVEEELEGCDAEVHRLQCHIIFLQNHRKRLDEYKMCLHSLMSPLRKLPNEILLRIFDWACDMNEITTGKIETMPALAISCVCSHWRTVAIASPDIWARLRVNLTAMHLDRMEFSLLDMFLERSQHSPFTLEILGQRLEILEPRQASVCSTLGAYSERWKELIVSQPTIYKALLAHDLNHFPVLDALTISNFGFRLPGSLDRFQDASQLHSLSVSSFPLGKLHKSTFPWKQLSSLCMGSYSKEVKYVVEVPCNLTTLGFFEWEDGSFRRHTSPITALTVQTLSLSVSQTSHPDYERLIDVVLSSMTLPSLKSMSIDRIDVMDEYEHAWPTEIVQTFLSRSSCSLTALSIKSVPVLDTDLIDLLRRLPSLLHLIVDDSGVAAHRSPITSRFIESLNAFHYNGKGFASSILVRNLQSLSLTFSGVGHESFRDREFVEVVSSRWYSGCYTNNSEIGTACLNSVVMQFLNRDVDPDIYAPLKHLEKAGMKVVVTDFAQGWKGGSQGSWSISKRPE